MKEVEILKDQMATERAHAAQVAQACAAAFGAQEPASASAESLQGFRDGCVAYLVWVLARFEERDQSLSDRLRSDRHRSPGGQRGPDARAVSEVMGREGTSREALSRLEAALSANAPQAWREFARFFNSAWNPRRNALDERLMPWLSVADWRAVCAIDADSILEERARFARVVSQHPPAVASLTPAAPQDR